MVNSISRIRLPWDSMWEPAFQSLTMRAQPFENSPDSTGALIEARFERQLQYTNSIAHRLRPMTQLCPLTRGAGAICCDQGERPV
jgi:hypothetical protein